MKAQGHPQYFPEAQVICACGNKFTVGSTMETIHIELCNKCHPFYTGEARFVDTESRIKKFQHKQDLAKKYVVTSEQKKAAEKKKSEGPKTLREMLESLQ